MGFEIIASWQRSRYRRRYLAQESLNRLQHKLAKFQTHPHSLRLNGCRLAELPECVVDLASATHVNLSNNRLRTIPVRIADCEHLETLLLGRNYIDGITNQFDRLCNLYSLQMQNNSLTSIPSSIGKLENLSYTIWTSNQIAHVPDELTTLAKLKHLQLNNNQITRFPSDIGNLKLLRELWLTNNCLTLLPDSISNLTNLKYLGIGGNRIGDEAIGILENMSWLKWLDITNTDLSDDAIEHLFDRLPDCEIYSGKRPNAR